MIVMSGIPEKVWITTESVLCIGDVLNKFTANERTERVQGEQYLRT